MSTRMKSAKALATRVVREHVIEAMKGISLPLETDRWIYRMVIIILGLTILVCLVGVFALSMEEKPVPEFMVVLASGATGSLAGLLAPAPKRR